MHIFIDLVSVPLPTNTHTHTRARTCTKCTRSWCWWSSGSLWAETDDGWMGVDDCVGWLLAPFLFSLPALPIKYPSLCPSLLLAIPSLTLSFPPFTPSSKSFFFPADEWWIEDLFWVCASFLTLKVSASPLFGSCTIYKTIVGQEDEETRHVLQWTKKERGIENLR